MEVILKQDVTSLHNRKCVCVEGGPHSGAPWCSAGAHDNIRTHLVLCVILVMQENNMKEDGKGEALLLTSGAYPPSVPLLLWKRLEPSHHDMPSVFPVSVIVIAVTYYLSTKVG